MMSAAFGLEIQVQIHLTIIRITTLMGVDIPAIPIMEGVTMAGTEALMEAEDIIDPVVRGT